MTRVVSLLPSSTEIICDLGCRDLLVGRSHECDYPSDVGALPACTAPKFDPDGTSYEIDQRVKAILQEALSVYRVDAEQLDALAPDLIVTQSQCEVCAVNLRDVEEAACRIIGSQPRIVSLECYTLKEVGESIQVVAEALGVSAKGNALVQEMNEWLKRLGDQTRDLPRPTVACIEWLEPLMAAGNWVPELVEIAGGDNLFGAAGRHSPWMDWEQLVASDPDVLVIMPCGFDMDTARRETAALTERAGWAELCAVRQGRVYVTDGNQYFNRPGPRLVESGEILAEIFYPERFSFGHRDSGWSVF